ncbi:MAG: PA0069 family radical SAM protein [Cyclobacteriaceae bacterium]|jgi:DNA repair photolyase|nr:PA0069 family radical SAM protein [Cyclobacteriaceae bacterium]
MVDESYKKGRGAQIKPANRFSKSSVEKEHFEGIDDFTESDIRTQFFLEKAASIVNVVNSPDVGMQYSVNPYQGCEHGCVYCYARNSHEYWGFNAGLDFESKIVVKENAPALLEKFLLSKTWQPAPISLSGNTDCYQPAERKFKITRQLLHVLAKYKNPVSIITKNSLVLRDADILKDLASENLVHVYVSITSLDEAVRQLLEPRTATAKKRLMIIETLAKAGIPVGVMVAPIIPAINQHEIANIVKAAADAGACSANMIVVRLNGAIASIFKDWLKKNYPDRWEKVWHQIESLHNGKVNDSRPGTRMRGEGPMAEIILQVFKQAKRKHFGEKQMPAYNLTLFRKGGSFSLF